MRGRRERSRRARRAAACIAAGGLLTLAACTSPPRGAPSSSAASRTAGTTASAAGSSPSGTGGAQAPAPFAGQILAYAVHGFSAAQLSALRRALAVPVVAAYTTERQLRTANAALTIPVSTLYTDADAYAAAAGEPALAAQLRSGLVLAASEAVLRHAAVGDLITFTDGVKLPVTAIVDDHLVGGHEMATANAALRPRGQATTYLLVGGGQTVAAVRSRVTAVVAGTRVRVETSTANGFLSSSDTVLTQLQIKERFGEFSMQRLANGDVAPAYSWELSHITDRRITQLGLVSCNKAVVADLTAAMTEITRRNLGATVHTADFAYEGGCYNPRVIPFSSGGSLSAHTWGIAVDINVDVNPLGAAPHQDPRLVAIMRAHNFMWGGTFLRPDAAHFEWVGPSVKH
ncbi:MAG: hypothetical protein QOI42_417 [Frankiaceae bacterium]|nr:hypothetical protein [Frankiaceae bacterium]